MGLFNVTFGLLTIAVASPVAGVFAFTSGALMIFFAREDVA